MSTTLFFKHQRFVGAALVLLAVWYVVFEWEWFSYTDGDPNVDKRCYSPNHEYYIVRLQTPFDALAADSLYVSGTAKLYDKSDALLYTGRTLLSGESGPRWYGGLPGATPSVVFVGNDHKTNPNGWAFDLPGSPGQLDRAKNCY
jgi:hypothetical protein